MKLLLLDSNDHRWGFQLAGLLKDEALFMGRHAPTLEARVEVVDPPEPATLARAIEASSRDVASSIAQHNQSTTVVLASATHSFTRATFLAFSTLLQPE
ncbi:hypothetical protein ABZP36_007472 [Zizania latifolia]